MTWCRRRVYYRVCFGKAGGFISSGISWLGIWYRGIFYRAEGGRPFDEFVAGRRLFLVGAGFLNFSPQFGGKATKEQKAFYATTGHYMDGIFLNDEEIVMEINCHSITAMFKEIMNPDPNVAPDKNIDVEKIDPKTLGNSPDSLTRITWLGHSSFLIEISGKKILIDPIFSQYAAPHPLLGRARFNREMPIAISDFSEVDAVIISHDHYDHLDLKSIERLAPKVGEFYTALGVARHLISWGVNASRITEFDWWEAHDFHGIKITFTPTRHFSARGMRDRFHGLWGGWPLQNASEHIWWSGDGGYGEHFKERN